MSVGKYERTATFYQTRVTGGVLSELAEAVEDFIAEAPESGLWYIEGDTVILELSMGERLVPRRD